MCLFWLTNVIKQGIRKSKTITTCNSHSDESCPFGSMPKAPIISIPPLGGTKKYQCQFSGIQGLIQMTTSMLYFVVGLLKTRLWQAGLCYPLHIDLSYSLLAHTHWHAWVIPLCVALVSVKGHSIQGHQYIYCIISLYLPACDIF
jgi:hypothetical protein